MTRAELRTYGGTLAYSGALVAVILIGQGLADKVDRMGDERAEYRRWVTDACLPNEGEVAIAKNDGTRLSCTIYSRNAAGFAPVVVSAAVMEVPL